jgi:hypothetical protein
MQALTTALGPAPRMQALTTARPLPPLSPQVHELPGSPHALTVSSTAADARGCTLFDAGARMHKTTQVAGTKLHAFIQVADRFGNSCLPQPGQC